MAVTDLESVQRLIDKAAKSGANLDRLAEGVETQRKSLPPEVARGDLSGFDATLRNQDENSILARSRRSPYGTMAGVTGRNSLLSFLWTLSPEYLRKAVPDWSIFPNYRDSVLKTLWKRENIMAGAVYSMSSRIKSLDYDITGPSKRLTKYFKDLFRRADFGEGYGSLVTKLSVDLNTTDNGFFLEIAGPGHLLGERKGLPTDIHHLDSNLCWRTFDPDYPVVYINPEYNTYHLMHKSRVMMGSSMPQPDELARNVGFCAVSRSLMNLEYVRDVQTYKSEKVSGRFNRAIGWGQGFTRPQFDESIEQAELDALSKGFTVYKGIPFIFSMKDGATLNKLDLAALPDGFDFEKEVNIIVSVYALAFGVDVREFWPSVGPGASKADATIAHLKTRGKGYADILETLESGYSNDVFPPESDTHFVHDYTDPEQDDVVAKLQGQLIDNVLKMVKDGEIDSDEARMIFIAQKILDPNLLKSDEQRKADSQAKLQEQQQQMADQAKLQAEANPNQPPAGKPGEQATKPKAGEPKPVANPDHSQPRKTFMPNNPAQKAIEAVPEEYDSEEIDDVYKEYKRIIGRG